MIDEWAVRNFKSLKALGVVKFQGITLFAGANSSGKSSILQSILVLKQTMQYGAASRSLTLNGPLLKLGSMESIHNSSSEGEPIEIEMDFNTREIMRHAQRYEDWQRALWRPEGGDIENIRLSLKFKLPVQNLLSQSDSSDAGSLTPTLAETTVSVKRILPDGSAQVARTTFRAQDADNSLHLPYDRYRTILNDSDKAAILERRIGSKIVGGWISYFLPSWIWVEYDKTADDADEIAKSLLADNWGLLGGIEAPSSTVPAEISAKIFTYLEEKGMEAGELSDTSLTFQKLKSLLVDKLGVVATRGIGSFLLSKEVPNDTKEELRTLVVEGYIEARGEERDTEPVKVPSLNPVELFLRSFLKDGIRYLGPLRDAPRPVYQPEALENITSVGYRGEHTAAVLDLNRDSMVSYFRPPETAGDQFDLSSFKSTRRPLIAAVNDWLAYLEVADGIRTEDAGVYGNRIQVSPKGGDRLHDLTNVGVGVSQVLPIVVSSLLAEPGSILIFEQPELHLHPRVQARLADFFIALRLTGLQVLIETHSEYMIDRFRLRIAQAGTDDLREMVSMYFLRKLKDETTITRVDINEYGAIGNWPSDFFDQSRSDIGKLLKAASRKRTQGGGGSE